MANVPSNSTAVTVLQGQSITGSFAGFIPCTNTINNYADFRGLKEYL